MNCCNQLVLRHICANPGGHAVKGVDLWLLNCSDRGFESLEGHGYFSFVFLVCCVGIALCNKLITSSEEFYWMCCLIVCDIETSKMRLSRPDLGCSTTEKNLTCYFCCHLLYSAQLGQNSVENILLVSCCFEIPVFHVLLHQFCDLPSLLLWLWLVLLHKNKF